MPLRSRPTVYLHIGLIKTGTTYLQGVVWANAQRLEPAGLRYPGHGIDHFHASIDLRDQPFLGDPATHRPSAWNRVAGEARSAPDRALISHETFSRATPEQVQRAVSSLAPAEVHLILTLRDLGRQVPAVWQERIKNRSEESYARFLRDITGRPRKRGVVHFWQGQDVLDVLRRWDAIPPERVHVVTVPSADSPRELLWERFASVLGVDPGLARTAPPRSNVSLGVEEAELLRRINPYLRESVGSWLRYERAVKTRFANDMLAGLASEPRLVVPDEYQPWLTERARAMIDGLSDGGFDIVGDIADLEPDFGDQPFAAPSDVSPERLLELAGRCVAELIAENDALQRTLDRTPRAQMQKAGRRLRRRVDAALGFSRRP
ncbi:MAG: hypothetical protein GEU93_08760 [Propionibacteriales bacterium]|nr:hypothetical protein [Propionibacteriales bacterium]